MAISGNGHTRVVYTERRSGDDATVAVLLTAALSQVVRVKSEQMQRYLFKETHQNSLN